METIPYIQVFKFLKRLQEDINVDDIVNIQPPRSTDILAAQKEELHKHYHGTDRHIKTYLIDRGLISENLNISNEGLIYLKKYSGCFGYLELLAKDYPFLVGALLFGMFGGFIGNLIIELIIYLFTK